MKQETNKVILKVIRCNQYQYRLGLHLPEMTFENATRVMIKICGESFECKLSYAHRYRSFICKQIGECINKNNWGHKAYQPITLLVFKLNKADDEIRLVYIGKSRYVKKSGGRINRYYKDGTGPIIVFSSTEKEIKELAVCEK